MSNPVILVTGGFDHKIRFWDATGGNCIKSIPHNTSQVNCLSISADKSLLACGGNPHINLFDINSNSDAPILSFDGHMGNVTTVGFQKDLKWLFSASEDGTVKVWDPRSPTCQRSYDCQGGVNAVSLHPNQMELISGDQHGFVKIWDLAEGNLATSGGGSTVCREEYLPVPEVAVRSIAMGRDASLLAVGSHKGRLCVYAPNESKTGYVKEKEILAHDDYLLKCVVSPSLSTIATTSADRTIKLWNSATGELQSTLNQHQRWVWDAVFSADSQYMISVSSDQTAKLWNLRSGEVMKSYVGHGLAVTCVVLNDSSASS